jgi:mannitol/fructose-specific phosphotransferase system IIA component (Ntr-type)
MNLSDYLREESIQTGVTAPDKPSVLKAIARLAKKSLLLQAVSEEEIFQGLMAREKLGSTGFGNGIAIPHCAMEYVMDFVVGVLVVPDGVDFDALDGEKTKLFVFIIAPSEKKNEHIQVLSSISRVLRSPDNVSEILTGQSASIIRGSFLRHMPVETEVKPRKAYKQFTIIVQHEDLFNDILTVFTEIPKCFVSVIEASNASRYLYSLPLFAHFWSEEQKGFSRIIIAAVDASLSNEAIRRINMIIDEMSDPSGVLLLSQDISYLNGSLSL